MGPVLCVALGACRDVLVKISKVIDDLLHCVRVVVLLPGCPVPALIVQLLSLLAYTCGLNLKSSLALRNTDVCLLGGAA